MNMSAETKALLAKSLLAGAVAVGSVILEGLKAIQSNKDSDKKADEIAE